MPLANTRTRIRGMNRRQRKKIRVGEFQEFVFAFRLATHTPLSAGDFAHFSAEFGRFVGEAGPIVGGMARLEEHGAIFGSVASRDRGSPSEENRSAVEGWLKARPEVASTEVGPMFDAWR
ncbi:50S ribosome-binding protein YggL [Niveibacterium umoris]|uniref:DUF469 family protein n=1 Tax=Niveibacterium umoris TaxID=1193620 RepID=A0A840BTC4_9RHOO|nr:50S ribosome-binding protein YggL [Niveibacterium umoris]MBB4013607.1 hypothetical protein [Niveibacterium umoris]